MTTNDNEPLMHGVTFSSSDPHGLAALLLVESLIHGLCESSTLSNVQAIEIAERAVDVQFDQVAAANGDSTPLRQSLTLLSSIATSLRSDGGDDAPTHPHLVP